MGLFDGGNMGPTKAHGGGWGSGPANRGPKEGGGNRTVGGFNPFGNQMIGGGRPRLNPVGHQIVGNAPVLPPIQYPAMNPQLMQIANQLAQFYGLGLMPGTGA